MTERSLLEDIVIADRTFTFSFILDIMVLAYKRELDVLIVGETHGVPSQHALMTCLLAHSGDKIGLFLEEQDTFFTGKKKKGEWYKGYEKSVFDPWDLKDFNPQCEGLLVTYTGSAHAHPLVVKDYQFCANEDDPFYQMTQQEDFQTVQEALAKTGRQVKTLLMFDEDKISEDYQNKILSANKNSIRGLRDLSILLERGRELLGGVNNRGVYQLRSDVYVGISPGVIPKGEPEIISNFLAMMKCGRLGNYIHENRLIFKNGSQARDRSSMSKGGLIVGKLEFYHPGEQVLEIIFREQDGVRAPSETRIYDSQTKRYEMAHLL